MIDSGLAGVPQGQMMLKGHLSRIIYHQVYQYAKKTHISIHIGSAQYKRDTSHASKESDSKRSDAECMGFAPGRYQIVENGVAEVRVASQRRGGCVGRCQFENGRTDGSVASENGRADGSVASERGVVPDR